MGTTSVQVRHAGGGLRSGGPRDVQAGGALETSVNSGERQYCSNGNIVILGSSTSTSTSTNTSTSNRARPVHLPCFMLVDLYLGLAGVARTGQGGQEFQS